VKRDLGKSFPRIHSQYKCRPYDSRANLSKIEVGEDAWVNATWEKARSKGFRGKTPPFLTRQKIALTRAL